MSSPARPTLRSRNRGPIDLRRPRSDPAHGRPDRGHGAPPRPRGPSPRPGLPADAAVSAFSLIELLVVIGVITVLLALILPATSHARFRAGVTACSNNYRQWGVAVALYAADDGKGRLPSFALPVDQMVQYSALEPWFVPFELVTNLAPHGVTVPMWFCPLRPGALARHRDGFRHRTGRELRTASDLVEEFQMTQGSAFAFPDLFWWVPRRLGAASLEYPDPKLMKTRVPDPWPSRMDDPGISSMPLVSDWLVGRREDSKVVDTGGGHRWGGALRNNNAAFADGHVESRPARQLEWQAESPRGLLYLY